MATINVKSLYDGAISFCSQKSGKTGSEVLNLLREGDVWAHSTFRYSLAKNLCDYLAADNAIRNTIRAVYLFGSSAKNEASFGSDIDLIFHVSKKTGRLENVLNDIDGHISRRYSAMMGSRAKGMGGLLDFKMVDDKEVKKKKGFASVINSIYEPPYKIWGK